MNLHTQSTGRIILFGLTTLIYWNRLIIWPIIYKLSLMCPFLSPLSSSPLHLLFLLLIPSSLPFFYLSPREIMDKKQKPELPSLLQFERWLHANNTPSALYSIISDFWGLCAMYCPWDSVTETTEDSYKSGPPKNRAAPQWLSSHCALLPITDG